MMNATQSTAAIDQPAGLSQELLDECRQLALTVAPELARDPLYFENAPADYPRTPTMIALAVDSRDFRTRRMLIDFGRYQGPGRTVLFFDGTLDRISALGVALHETGHVLEYPIYEEIVPTAEQSEFQSAWLAAFMSARVAGEKPMPRWFGGHAAAFIRNCLHLTYRAQQASVWIGWPDVGFAGEQYDLSHPWKYARALGDEPRRMIGESFETIMAEPAPAEFIEFFRADAVECATRLRETIKGENQCPQF